VWLNSPEQIAATALATCSGSTSRLSSVRATASTLSNAARLAAKEALAHLALVEP